MLEAKYAVTAWFYDFLDYPWERLYRTWRPRLVGDVTGRVLEAGSGTGRNFAYYPSHVSVTAIELSEAMIKKSTRRARAAACTLDVRHDDATQMRSVESAHYDWLVSTFMCCVMPDELQPLAVQQFARVLKPGGRFRLLEMVYSKSPGIRRGQQLFAPLVEKVYGARFDRNTLRYVEESEALEITDTYFLKDDVYLVIEGRRLES